MRPSRFTLTSGTLVDRRRSSLGIGRDHPARSVLSRISPERQGRGDHSQDDGHDDEHGEDGGIKDSYEAHEVSNRMSDQVPISSTHQRQVQH